MIIKENFGVRQDEIPANAGRTKKRRAGFVEILPGV
jgi:hypothetical protein